MEFRMTAITAKDNPSIQLYRKLVRQRKAPKQVLYVALSGEASVYDILRRQEGVTE